MIKTKNITYIIVYIFIFILQTTVISAQQFYNQDDILKGHVIFKVKPEFRSFCYNDGVNQPDLAQALSYIKATSCIRKFPNSKQPETPYNRYGQRLTDISLIYEATFSPSIPVEKALSVISQTGIAEYAVPHVINKPLYTPNDPGAGSQYHLSLIKALNAWDINKGDTSVIIGILDTGTDWDHPDLAGNIKYNFNDLPDGIDNDNDGYVDNFRGWDVAENDNNPQIVSDAHGVHVCGIASAKTNNGIGVAGVGFLSRFLPVKVAGDDGSFIHSYEGIVYAADHGCNIINCSWGGKTSAGPYGQDIINYAVFNKDALVIAACGNDNNEIPFFPASYDNVVSVAATDQNDLKNGTSSYGIYVDFCAPGKNIFSTWDGGSYVNYSGTSMSAPVVSGCAAIVKSAFPSYNALQIAEQLRATADKIDSIGTNYLFAGKLGSGRVNLFKAITETPPSVRITNISINDNNDNIYTSGDTLIITADFINYLQDVTDLNVKISSESPYIVITDSSAFFPSITTMNTVSNNTLPFKLYILPGIPFNSTDIEIKVEYSAANYSSHEYFELKLNKDYVDIDNNLLATTITGRGKLGHNDYYSREGVGFTFRGGKNIMYCGGLMAGNNSGQVSDNIYSATIGFDEDFKAVTNITNSLSAGAGYFSYNNIFNDSLAGATTMGLEINQRATAYTGIDSSNFIILDYTIKNKGQTALQTLYAGLFVDWDINDYSANRTLWDASANLSYTFPVDGGKYSGIMLLSPSNAKSYAFDTDGSSGSINIYDGFSSSEKYSALINNRFSAGQAPGGNDIASLVSSGPFNLHTGDSVNVVFALLAGDNYYDIMQSALMAKDKYYNISGTDNLYNSYLNDKPFIYPNPAEEDFIIKFEHIITSDIYIKIYDAMGKNVYKCYKSYIPGNKSEFHISTGKLSPGIYFCEVQSEAKTDVIKLIIK